MEIFPQIVWLKNKKHPANPILISIYRNFWFEKTIHLFHTELDTFIFM